MHRCSTRSRRSTDLDTLVDFGVLDTDDITDARDLQNQMIALLVTMARNNSTGPNNPFPFTPPPSNE